MNAVSEIVSRDDQGAGSCLAVTETYWGYIVREIDMTETRREIRELLLLFVGALFFAVAFGQWLLPGASVVAEVLPFKMALTAVFVGFGGVCWHAAGPRAQVEVQVDTALRELRVVARDRRSLTQLLQRIEMKNIDSVYINRVEDEDDRCHVLLEVAGSDNPLHFASGSERQMELLHNRLCRDLRPAHERVERRLMRMAEDAMTDPEFA